jgi:hypothetical protein
MSGSRSLATLVVAWACLTVALDVSSAQAGGTPERMKVLLMGLVDKSLNPLSDWLSIEPGTTFSAVPSRLVVGSFEDSHGEAFQGEIRRFIRIYFPRTLDDLQEYEVMLFSSILVTMYSDTQIDWLVRSIRDGGACAIADTGGMMGKNPLMYIPWAESTMSEAFPCDADKTAAFFGSGSAPNLDEFRVELNPNVSDPVFAPFLPFGIQKWKGASGRIDACCIWGCPPLGALLGLRRGDYLVHRGCTPLSLLE